MLLVVFALLLTAHACLSPTDEVFAVTNILQSISDNNNGLSLMSTPWQTFPTVERLCSDYPGIVCDDDCSVTALNMVPWWADIENQGSWNVGSGIRVDVPDFPTLGLFYLTQMESLTLTIASNSTGVLPGSEDGIDSSSDSLPAGLVFYYVKGLYADQANAVTAGDVNTKALYSNMLSPGRPYASLLLFFIEDMPGLGSEFGIDGMQTCIDTFQVRLVNVTTSHGSRVCFTNRTQLAVFVNTNVTSFEEANLCGNAITPGGQLPSQFAVINTNLTVLPSCIKQKCIDNNENDLAGQFAFYDNKVCNVGQNQAEDVELNLNTVAPPSFAYRSSSSGFGYNFDGSFPCVTERDNRDCIDCSGDEAPVGDPEPPHWDPICESCGTDGEYCRDCDRVPHGTSAYDQCDVCDGDGSACLDCDGEPFGSSAYDSCDVCNGDDACVDCSEQTFGTLEVDRCGVCGGHDECVDCTDTPHGTVQVDRCGVCGGSNECAPCRETQKDICGVCSGDGSTCRDCLGDVFGSAVYDACDVCDGDSRSCVDCAGVPNGPRMYDVCDVCNGNGESCLGCDGMPFGGAYDRCDVCGGDDACLDCLGEPNGLAQYDECGVCDGDGSSCLDCFGEFDGTGMLNVCGQCYDPETSTMWDCIPELVDERLSHTLTVWIVVASLLMVIICIFAWAFCYRCGAFMWVFLKAAKPLTISRPRRGSLGSADKPKQEIVYGKLPPAPAKAQARGGAGGFGRSFAIATVLTVMLSVAHALPPLTQANTLYHELCAHTNIHSQVLGACNAAEPISVCDAPSGLSAFFECYADMPGLVKRANLDGIPTLRGHITMAAWDALRQAETLNIAVNSVRVYDDDDFNDADIPEDRLIIEALGDDDAFRDFTQLMFLELEGVYVEPGTQLPTSLGDSNRLITLELIDIANLGGEFGKDDILCSLPVLETLRVRGTQLTGVPRCNYYQSTWRSLKELDVRNNHLTGGLPDLNDLTTLKLIYADHNRLTSPPLPSQLPERLHVLSMAYNDLQGTLDGAWQYLEDLVEFYIDGNQLIGPVPLLDVHGLKGFGISFNFFVGTLPPEYATQQDGAYTEIRVDDNLLMEPWPPFSSDQLSGECAFEHNAICRYFESPTPSAPPQPTPCGLCSAVDPITACTNQGVCREDENAVLRCTIDNKNTFGKSPSCGLCTELGTACDCDDCYCHGQDEDAQPLDTLDFCFGTPAEPTPSPPTPTVYDEFRLSQCTYSFEHASLCDGGCGDVSCVGCDGQPNSGLVRDACGVCDGTNSTCTDCNGVLHGTSQRDICGVCDGDGSTCDDCAGQPHGTYQYDLCDVCGGDNTACADCFGVPRGDAQLDACGVCEGQDASCTDCAGVLFGTSRFDEYGVCNGEGRHPPPNTTLPGNQLAQDIRAVSFSAAVWWLVLEVVAITAACCLLACASVMIVQQGKKLRTRNKNS